MILESISRAVADTALTELSVLQQDINGANKTYHAKHVLLEDQYPALEIRMNGKEKALFVVTMGFIDYTPKGIMNGMTFCLTVNTVNEVTNLQTEHQSKVINWLDNHVPVLKEVGIDETVVKSDALAKVYEKSQLAEKYLKLIECKCGSLKVEAYSCENTSCPTHNE